MGRFLLSEAELIELYVNQRLSSQKIADMYGFCFTTVLDRLKKFGIKIRSNSESHVGLQSGISNPNWKNGGINEHGYRRISHNGRQRLEHRVVMEQAIGRRLRDDEHIHHKNGNKSDNRLENLEIVDPVTHARIHVAEKMAAGTAGNIKMSFEKAAVIRSRHAAGETITAIAKDYGVSQSAISRIVLGRTWVNQQGEL